MSYPKHPKAWSQSQEGKGTGGCLVFLALLALSGVIAVRAVPPYYAYKSLETDVKTEVSRAGANFYDNESIIRNVLSLAKKNEIRIKRSNVKLDRFAGQIHVRVQWTEEIDFLVYPYDMTFRIKASSYIGRL